jgi:hypothetical protein
MKNMYLIFTLGNTIFSEIIAKTTKDRHTDWKDVPSHVAIVFFDYLVVESKAFGGFTISTLDHFLSDKVKVTFIYQVPESDLELAHKKLEEIIREKRKTRYDWFGAIWLGISNLLKLRFGVKIVKNPFNNARRDFCVEMVEMILGRYLSNTSPLELEKELRKSQINS